MASQHATREAQELAQHTDHEAREDLWDVQQTFEGHFRVPKTPEEVMRLLNISGENNLLETL